MRGRGRGTESGVTATDDMNIDTMIDTAMRDDDETRTVTRTTLTVLKGLH